MAEVGIEVKILLLLVKISTSLSLLIGEKL